ncbi:MAG: NUDIX domain-containing protein [Patescibacteria group bacterium]|jgi:8-oxo-dGTP pyrophosphatase MutT (NUDIX family)
MDDQPNLNIIDETGKIVGEDSRTNVHDKGLLHQEIHVWFFTSDGKIIFQHRAKDKDTFPNLLDASVGGHVEKGEKYIDTALKEIKEETGLRVTSDKLRYIKTQRSTSYDPVTSRTNNVLRAVFAYRYDGLIESLMIEQGKGIGFEAWPLKTILNISSEEKKRFIPTIFNPDIIDVFHKIVLIIQRES